MDSNDTVCPLVTRAATCSACAGAGGGPCCGTTGAGSGGGPGTIGAAFGGGGGAAAEC